LVWVNSCGLDWRAVAFARRRVKFVSRLPMSEGFRVFGLFRGQEDYPQPIFDALKR